MGSASVSVNEILRMTPAQTADWFAGRPVAWSDHFTDAKLQARYDRQRKELEGAVLAVAVIFEKALMQDSQDTGRRLRHLREAVQIDSGDMQSRRLLLAMIMQLVALGLNTGAA
jgi:hypothetical protein